MENTVQEFRVVQVADVNVREPENVIACLSGMAKVSFDADFVKYFLQSDIVPTGGQIRITFYSTGKHRSDKEIKGHFEKKIAFDASQFVSLLCAVLNYQLDPKSTQKCLSNSGRAVCFVVSDKDNEKEYTVTVAFKPFPLLEWRVRVFEEGEYRWRTNDWLVVPG